ncbi:unnamed protein product [Ilex paraguariensis]|uniref:Uncharacterized protein n=1 Tax=Ilex paraguariensis TaxID=185542 RepID=A0ABC8QPV5_9AQUA
MPPGAPNDCENAPSMGRQSSVKMPVGSSIALLQERFKQLQRVREQREERELRKFFPEPKRIAPVQQSEPAKLLFRFRHETIFPASSTLQNSVSLGLNPCNQHAEFRAVKASPSRNLRSIDKEIVSTTRSSDNSDVDTSLHL